MNYQRLGKSGLEVSRLCLGTMMFGDRTDAAVAGEIIAHALDAGVNFIDTADAYAKGASEAIVGPAIARGRDRLILATKVGNPVQDAPHEGGLSRRWIVAACEGSLKRLNTDWIDIYYLHKDDLHTPLAETIATIGDLIRAGKVRYFGISNYRGWRIAELMHWCAARKDRRMMETEFRAESFAIAERLEAHARATGRTPIQFALAWLWANRIVTSVIAGPRTLEQWNDYVAAMGTPWSDDD